MATDPNVPPQRDDLTEDGVRVSIVIPCLDEADTIAECVTRARGVLERAGITGEVMVVDNGSVDGSGAIAAAAGARLISEPRRGYGRAYRTGFAAARGEQIVMIDADLTYDFDEIPTFLASLDQGADLVVGNRMRNVAPGAMSTLSRVGNPILSGLLNLVHDSPIGDAHCGLRALQRETLAGLELRADGMEFASEMVIRAAKLRLDVREIPVSLSQRGGRSKLMPFRDGWRHLRLILIHNPTALFIVPGLATAGLGALTALAVFAHLDILGRTWSVHTLIGAAALVIVGAQIVGLGLCGRAYAHFILGDADRLFERYSGRYRLEHGLVAGLTIAGAGAAIGAYVVSRWIAHRFGALGETSAAIGAMILVVTGLQVFFTSFLISLLGLRRER